MAYETPGDDDLTVPSDKCDGAGEKYNDTHSTETEGKRQTPPYHQPQHKTLALIIVGCSPPTSDDARGACFGRVASEVAPVLQSRMLITP